MFHHQNLGGNRAALVILCLVGVRMAINLVQGVVCRSIIYLSAVNVKEFEATVRRNLVDTIKYMQVRPYPSTTGCHWQASQHSIRAIINLPGTETGCKYLGKIITFLLMYYYKSPAHRSPNPVVSIPPKCWTTRWIIGSSLGLAQPTFRYFKNLDRYSRRLSVWAVRRSPYFRTFWDLGSAPFQELHVT